ACDRLRRQVLEDLSDVESGRLPGQDALHPGMRVVPESAALPERKQAVEAREEVPDIADFGSVDVLVEPQALELLGIPASPVPLAPVSLDRHVQWVKPLSERLPLSAGRLLETLRAGRAPGLDIIEALLGHEHFEIIEQGVQVVVEQVVA